MKETPPVAVLHAGAMKTGTTFLQTKLIANSDRLAAHDVHFAGRYWGEQVHAVQDLLGLAQHDPVVAARTTGAWDRFVDEAADSEARTVLMSMEFLSFADAAGAQRAVTTLEERTGREVHLVLTVRDTARVVPALWQTSITSGGITTWPRFTKVVRTSIRGGGRVGAGLARVGLPTARRFVEVIDTPRMVGVWTSVLPAHRVHVVVVPGPTAPPDRLWDLFCGATGLDPTVATEPPAQANESLGYPSAELVRRLNEELALHGPTQQRVVKHDLARDALSRLRHEERRVALDPETFEATLRWNGRIVTAIRSSGAMVYGDFADLPTTADPADYTVEADQPPPSDDELLRAAAVGFRRLRQRHRMMSQRNLPPARAKKRHRRVRRRLIKRRNWLANPDPLGAAIADLATLCRALIGLERMLARRQKQLRRLQRRRRQRRRAQRNAAARRSDVDGQSGEPDPS